MNILASLNQIKTYLKGDISPEDFRRDMDEKSMSVEHIDTLRARFAHMVIGEVKELKAHPNADKLRIAMTDIGKEVVQIVCGGANLKDGQRVLVALPGAKVRWHGEGDLIEMKEAAIRGEKSFGMICAPSEIGFEKVPCGEKDIWDLSDLLDCKAGTSFVEALQMDDVIFELEVTTNRPDSMNIIGLAREAGAALTVDFEMEEVPDVPAAEGEKALTVSVQETDLCPRYSAVILDNVTVGPSPVWMQRDLLLAGYKPINNIVDITNWILHTYGQPMHAFDYEKLAGSELSVRLAKKGEKILALDDEEYELQNDQLVIADANGPVAVAGVMGGKESGTTDATTSIVFEAATFYKTSVRKTARALNLYSQSQSMFEKGLSPELPTHAMKKAVQLAMELAGAKVVSEVHDVRKEAFAPDVKTLQPERVRKLMGVEISDEQMTDYLTRLGFDLEKAENHYKVTVPFWRTDIENDIDFAEEIARMYGYGNIEARIPAMAPPTRPADKGPMEEARLKKLLMGAGYTEFYSNSMVSELDLIRYRLDPEKAVKMNNPLSSDLTHMRTSLVPSVLLGIALNQRMVTAGRVFELQRIYTPQKNDLPRESTELVIAHYGFDDSEIAFRQLRGALDLISVRTGLTFDLARYDGDERWHPSQSAIVHFEGKPVGMIGAPHPDILTSFKVEKGVMLLVLDIETLMPHISSALRYDAPPAFPSVERDLTVKISTEKTFEEIETEVKNIDGLVDSVRFVDDYREGLDSGMMNLTISISFRAADRTLTSEEVDGVMERIENTLSN